MQSFKKTTLNYLKTFSTIFALVLILSCSQTVGTDGGGSGGGNTASEDNTYSEEWLCDKNDQYRSYTFYVDGEKRKTIYVKVGQTIPANKAPLVNGKQAEWKSGGSNRYLNFDSSDVPGDYYTKSVYTVTFLYAYDHNNIINEQQVKNGEKATYVEPPKRDGMYFNKWTFNYPEEEFTWDKPITRDLRIWANYDSNYSIKHKIIWKTDEGKWEENFEPETSYSGNLWLNSNYNLKKDGYYFLGWYLEEDFSGEKIRTLESDLPEEITLYAQFVLDKEYSITYVLNGAEWKEEKDVPTSYKPSTLYNDRQLPGSYYILYEGYYFEGWYESQDFSGDKVSFIPEDATGNKIYYAKWRPYPTITYVLNGGEWIDHSNEQFTFYQAIPYKYCPYRGFTPPSYNYIKKDDYYFYGWYFDSDFTSPENPIISTDTWSLKDDVTLYAKWETLPTIKYELNGGSFTDDARDIVYKYDPNRSYKLPESKYITKEGYLFKGWYDNSEFTGNDLTWINNSSKENQTFYAKWEESSIVEFILNGGEWQESYKDQIPTEYKENLSLPNTYYLYKTGYNFEGWYETPDFSSERIYYLTENKKIVLYAKWTPGTYKFNFDLNDKDDAKWIKTPTTEYLYNTTFDLPSSDYLERPDYDFLGWNTKSDGSGEYYSKYTVGNISLKFYAIWKKHIDTLTITLGSFHSNLDDVSLTVKERVYEGGIGVTLELTSSKPSLLYDREFLWKLDGNIVSSNSNSSIYLYSISGGHHNVLVVISEDPYRQSIHSIGEDLGSITAEFTITK